MTDPIRPSAASPTNSSAPETTRQAPPAGFHKPDTLRSAKEPEGCLECLLPSCIVSCFRYIGSWIQSLWECLFGQERIKHPSLRKQRTLFIDCTALQKMEMLPREKDESEDDWILRSEFQAGINFPSPQQQLEDIEKIFNNKLVTWLDKESRQDLFPCRVVVRAQLMMVNLPEKTGGLRTGKLGSLYQKDDDAAQRVIADLEEFRDLLVSQEGKIRHYTIEFMHVQKMDETHFRFSNSMYGCKMGSPSLIILPGFSKTVTLEELNQLFADPRAILASDLVDEHGNLSTVEL